ncbi:MAG: 6-bladed beta-propeller [Candidatus Aminicenantes bacterium]|nr:6-bladed beta-propeller [Candidatus Aminicenantes bacterium]
MRRNAIFVLVTTVFLLTAFAQTVIENPAKPSSRNAGRVVSLKEEMRIEDTGEGFYFKTPYTIRVSPRGDVFIKDGQEQALQFDPQGRFVRNLFKKGQGPGELTRLLDVWASPDRLYLLGYPPKILVFNYDGKLVNEFSPRDTGIAGWFIRADAEGIIIRKHGQPDPSAGGGFKDIPDEIVEVSPDGTTAKTIGSFPIRSFIQFDEGGKGMSMFSWNQLQAVALDGNILFLNYTPEYFVEAFAKDKGAVVRRFTRPYARVKRTGGGGVSGPGDNTPPPPEFQSDIYALHVVDGKIWVQTTTVVEGKGILVDVFDPEGRYVDNFFIQSLMKNDDGKPVNMLLTIAGGFAYFRDKTEDELIVIKKCRLVGL